MAHVTQVTGKDGVIKQDVMPDKDAPKAELTLAEKKAEQEKKFHAILAKQREDAEKKAHVMTHDERRAQTEKFTAMIAKQSVGKQAPKVMTYEKKEANKAKMLDILDKQREAMAKGKK